MTESFSERNIRIEKSAVGSAIVSGDGNTIYVIHQGIEPQDEPTASTEAEAAEMGPNPYKGLAAFQAKDAANYFGREAQVSRLWQRFQDLYEQSGRPDSKPRFLPILGPSGCGKSSLARAGLVPELARRPLPGKEKMRVVVMVPGTSPLKSLAGVLAKLTQDDKTPEVIKKRRYEEELRKSAASGRFDFWQDVAETLLDVQSVPIVVLVDQFEEIYSLCEDVAEREAFVENLLYAAQSATGYVSVVVTLRSDFLGETQRHKELNQLISSDLSMIVPAMTEEELRRAIALPAEQAGQPLDGAIVDLLVNDAEGREGALPLLQFALTRIWEGLKVGKSPAETYREMDGVGGALAQKAQDIYDGLSVGEQEIARRMFLGLVQLVEGVRDTRRRAAIENLTTNRDTTDTVKQVVSRFSAPGARLVSLSSEANKEVAEVTHEALFDHWQLMNEWLDSSRDDIRFQRRLEEDAVYWEEQGRPEGLLWRPPDLDLLKKFAQSSSGELSPCSASFFEASDQSEKRERQRKKSLTIALVTALLATTTLSLFAGYKVHQGARRQMSLYEVRARDLADSDEIASLVNGLAAIGMSRSAFVQFPWISGRLLAGSEILEDANRSLKATHVFAHPTPFSQLVVSEDGSTLVVQDSDGTVRFLDTEGNPLSVASVERNSSGGIPALVVSEDGQIAAFGDTCTGIQLLNRDGSSMGEAFGDFSNSFNSAGPVEEGEDVRCMNLSLAISKDGQRIVSSSFLGPIELWNLNGEPILSPLTPADRASAVSISSDGKNIVSGSTSGAVQLWDETGNLIWTRLPENASQVLAVAISADGKTIASADAGGRIHLWNRQGEIEEKSIRTSLDSFGYTLALSANGKIVSVGNRNTFQRWNRNGELLETFKTPDRGSGNVSVASDGQTVVIASVGFDGSSNPYGDVRIWRKQDESTMVPQSISTEERRGIGVDIAADASTVASMGQLSGTIRLFDMQGKKISEFEGDLSEDIVRNSSIAVSADGETVFVYEGNVVRKFTKEGGLLNEFFGKEDGPPITDFFVSTDSQTILVTTLDDKVHLLDDEGNVLAPPFPSKWDEGYSVRGISRDGEMIVLGTGRFFKNNSMWELRDTTGEGLQFQIVDRSGNALSEIFTIDSSTATLPVVFSADNETLVVATTTAFLEAQKVDEVFSFNKKGELLSRFSLPDLESIATLTTSADGELMITGGTSGTIRFWDKEGRLIGEPLKAEAGVTDLQISANGKMLVSGHSDGQIKLWPVWLSEGWVSYTCTRLVNYLPERSKTSDVAKEAKRTCDRYAKN